MFFPALGAAAGTIASFVTFAVAFLARPLGAVAFGHCGDKLGRKKTLVSTTTIMGVSTVLIGLLGVGDRVLAPILLIVLRFGQGLAVGGEWAGAVLLAAVHAPAAHGVCTRRSRRWGHPGPAGAVVRDPGPVGAGPHTAPPRVLATRFPGEPAC